MGSFYLIQRNKPILYGYAICPYYQRVKAFLELKKIDHEVRMVDIVNKPDWFLKISPLGKVPVLTVGDRSLFESAFIMEYLDETFGPATYPTSPLEKCDHRSWITFAGEVQGNYI
jgi:glutathione S-transferase